MVFLLENIKNAYKNAYSKLYSEMPKNYIDAKIYHGGKNYDLKKRWYVYYSFIDPNTGKMKRQPPITFSVNRRFKTRKERMQHLRIIRDVVNDFLKKGYSPHKIKVVANEYSAESCLDYALTIKKTEIKQTTYSDYESRVNQFKKFLNKQGLLKSNIKNINKKVVSKYLNQFKGSKNRNNIKMVLSSIYNILSDEDYVEVNFIKELRNKKVTFKPIEIYSDDDFLNIENLLKEQNPTLLMYIYFISYMFWRPIENVRIKVENIDFEKNIIFVETKTKARKTKIIPGILINDLKKFIKGKKGYLFEPKNSNWKEVEETNRRDYYTKLFAKFRKKNNINSKFKMYHFRHTFITKIYLELRKELSKEDAVKKLSLITGHESKAIYNYIQVNDVELPQDYSEYLK